MRVGGNDPPQVARLRMRQQPQLGLALSRGLSTRADHPDPIGPVRAHFLPYRHGSIGQAGRSSGRTEMNNCRGETVYDQ